MPLLQLKMGALHLLQHLRVLGKKTMIIRFITEGPSDAQQWTMRPSVSHHTLMSNQAR